MALRDPPGAAQEAFDRAASTLAGVSMSRNKAELVDHLRHAAADLGAEQAYFACVVQAQDGVDTYRFLLACDPAWCIEYEKGECHLHDPWLAYARSHGRPVRSCEIPLRAQDEETAALAKKHGFASAMIVPASACEGPCQSGVLVLGSRSAGFLDGVTFRRLRILGRSLSMEIQDRLSDLLREECRAIYRLSPFEAQLLGWVRDGLTTKVIAKRLGWSLESIDCRFRRLNQKLGTGSRKASVRLAVEYGLICSRSA
jgi:DNA-binding CsgD family transcriptional regulator